MRTGATEIRYLSRSAIDIQKWDRCVRESPNGLIYHFSWYLDALCTWDALVEGDYDYILPLPWKKKLWVSYVYTPPFMAQSGIVSQQPVDREKVSDFVQAIPAHFLLADITLNEGNPSPDHLSVQQSVRVNMVLPLNEPYQQLATLFSKDGKKNINKALQSGLTVTGDVSTTQVLEMYKQAYGSKNKAARQQDSLFGRLSTVLLENGHGFTIGVKNAGGQVIATAFIAKDDKRIYYLLAAPDKAGRKAGAIHYLVDHLIKSYAGTGLCFDFEGSDIPSVAQFYKKFNPAENNYYLLRINRLPLWLRWLKK